MTQADVTNRFSISWRTVRARRLKKHEFFVYVANTGAPGDKLTNSLSYYGKFGGSIEKREADTMAAPRHDAIVRFFTYTRSLFPRRSSVVRRFHNRRERSESFLLFFLLIVLLRVLLFDTIRYIVYCFERKLPNRWWSFSTLCKCHIERRKFRTFGQGVAFIALGLRYCRKKWNVLYIYWYRFYVQRDRGKCTKYTEFISRL